MKFRGKQANPVVIAIYNVLRVGVLLGGCSPGWVFSWVGVLLGGCSPGWVFSWVGVLLGGCSPGWVFSWVGVLLGGCSPGWVFSWVGVAQALSQLTDQICEGYNFLMKVLHV